MALLAGLAPSVFMAAFLRKVNFIREKIPWRIKAFNVLGQESLKN